MIVYPFAVSHRRECEQLKADKANLEATIQSLNNRVSLSHRLLLSYICSPIYSIILSSPLLSCTCSSCSSTSLYFALLCIMLCCSTNYTVNMGVSDNSFRLASSMPIITFLFLTMSHLLHFISWYWATYSLHLPPSFPFIPFLSHCPVDCYYRSIPFFMITKGVQNWWKALPSDWKIDGQADK